MKKCKHLSMEVSKTFDGRLWGGGSSDPGVAGKHQTDP